MIRHLTLTAFASAAIKNLPNRCSSIVSTTN